MIDKALFDKYIEVFLQENAKINLISKNDEKFLWEKHICDSLGLQKFFSKYGIPQNLLDIGTGGGFPAIPAAIIYPQIKVTALDSIAKKIRAINNIKEKLNLTNLNTICARVENINAEFDVVTARAVASLDKLCTYALPKTKNGGYFVAFKSQKAQDEIKNTQNTLRNLHSKIIDIIEYTLPLEENFTRNLIVIQKK